MTYDYTISLKERTGGCQYKVQLLDALGAAITPARCTALTLSLRDVRTGSYINSREKQDVLTPGVHGVELAVTGWLTWTMAPADNAIITPTAQQAEEEHEATFTVKADTGAVELSWTVQVLVRTLADVP